MWYQAISYLKFISRSRKKHGVHSPFVYDLVTRCFNDKTSYPEYDLLKKHREIWKDSNEQIQVTDLGAGSRVFKSVSRKVADIARNAGISKKRQRLLFRLVNYFNSKRCLELGTSLGMGTAAMAMADASSKVITLEGCPNTAEIAQRGFDESGFDKIELRTQTFEAFFLQNDSEPFDLVFVDGNHSKEATLYSFHELLNLVHNDSVLIFDDIYWSAQMTEAWLEIIEYPGVSVSIDTFQWGVVFFRKEQEKQHFIIRL